MSIVLVPAIVGSGLPVLRQAPPRGAVVIPAAVFIPEGCDSGSFDGLGLPACSPRYSLLGLGSGVDIDDEEMTPAASSSYDGLDVASSGDLFGSAAWGLGVALDVAGAVEVENSLELVELPPAVALLLPPAPLPAAALASYSAPPDPDSNSDFAADGFWDWISSRASSDLLFESSNCKEVPPHTLGDHVRPSSPPPTHP